MSELNYSLPKLVKPTSDKIDTRWYIYYTIIIDGVKNYRKEYGLKNYNISLAKGTKEERERKALKLKELVTLHLSQGRDPQSILAVKKAKTVQKIEAEKKELENKISLDDAIAMVSASKGWDIDQVQEVRTNTKKNILSFYRGNWKKYLTKINKIDDIRAVNRKDISAMLEMYFNPKDENHKEWSATTCKINKAFIAIMFNVLLEKEMIEVNPCSGIKIKNDSEKIKLSRKANFTDRFASWTDDEVDAFWNYTDNEEYYRLHIFSKLIYYGFLRPSEISRLKVGMIDLEEQVINIPARLTKAHARYRVNEVVTIDMPDALVQSLQKWFEIEFPNGSKKDDYLVSSPKGTTSILPYATIHKMYIEVRTLLKKKYKYAYDVNIYALKHSGISKFFNVLIHDSTMTQASVIYTIMTQARHNSFSQTETYLRDHKLLFEGKRKKINF